MARFRSRRPAALARTLPRRVARPRSDQLGPPAAVMFAARGLDPLHATLTLSARGALVLPAALRRALAIEAGGELVAEATPDGLLLRPLLAFAPGLRRH